MITIYGDSISGNCLKVKFVADQLKLPYRWVETSVVKRETRTNDFLSINPAGQVPAVVLADGRLLSQSNAIMLHLAEGSALIPTDSYERAVMFQWLFWEQYSHEPTIATRRFRLSYAKIPVAEIDPGLKTGGDAALARMQGQLNGHDYFVADRLTLADIALVAYTRVAHEGGFDLAAYPRVLAWVRRIEKDLGLESALPPSLIEPA